MRWLLVILMLVAPLSQAPGQSAPDYDGLFGSGARFAERDGAAIYHRVCAGCHMPDGRGAAGAGAYPSLVKDEKLEVAAYPISLVLRGQGAMPWLGRYLDNQQVADVVGYIRTQFGNDYPDPPTAAEVAALR